MFFNLRPRFFALFFPKIRRKISLFSLTGIFFVPRTQILSLCNKTQPLQLPGVFRTGGDQVDPGGFKAGVP